MFLSINVLLYYFMVFREKYYSIAAFLKLDIYNIEIKSKFVQKFCLNESAIDTVLLQAGIFVERKSI